MYDIKDKNMKKNIKYGLLFFFGILMNFAAFAQEEEPGEIEDPTDPDPTDALPVNDYIWVLIILGLAYVFYKVRKKHIQQMNG